MFGMRSRAGNVPINFLKQSNYQLPEFCLKELQSRHGAVCTVISSLIFHFLVRAQTTMQHML